MWKADIPGLGWSSPIVWGDHVFVTTAVSSGAEVPPVKGLFDPIGDHSRSRSTAVHRWMLLDLDFTSGQAAMAARAPQRATTDGEADEEQLRVGDAGHRRRAGVRVLWRDRVRRGGRLQRASQSGPRSWGRSKAARPGARRHRRSSTRTACTSSTTTGCGRSSRRSTPGPVTRSGGSIARKLRTGRRRSSGRTTGAPRS